MAGSTFDPELAAAVPEIISYSVGAASLAISAIALRALRHGRKTEELLRISEQQRRLDPKTGLLNYPAFQEEFKERTGTTRRAAERDRVHGLLLADIDDFKALNTRLGLTRADELALKPVADIFKQSTRPESDAVARFGGEEFVLLLTDTDQEGLLTVCKRLQDGVNAIHPEGDLSEGLGITIAYTTFPQGTPLEELRVGLDMELVGAKAIAGKNQIIQLGGLAA